MSSDRATPSEPVVEAEDVPWYDYRPSAKLTLRDELRLLDQSLDEARARPRPPALGVMPPLPPLAHRPLGQISAQVAVVSARPDEETNGHQLSRSGGHVNGHELSTKGPAPRRQLQTQDEPDGREMSEDDHQMNGHRITAHNLLDPDDEVVVDRKRLLAAIICILQEELNRSK